MKLSTFAIISIVTLFLLAGLISLILYLTGFIGSGGNNYRYCVPPGRGVDCSKKCDDLTCDTGLCIDFANDPC